MYRRLKTAENFANAAITIQTELKKFISPVRLDQIDRMIVDFMRQLLQLCGTLVGFRSKLSSTKAGQRAGVCYNTLSPPV